METRDAERFVRNDSDSSARLAAAQGMETLSRRSIGTPAVATAPVSADQRKATDVLTTIILRLRAKQ